MFCVLGHLVAVGLIALPTVQPSLSYAQTNAGQDAAEQSNVDQDHAVQTNSDQDPAEQSNVDQDEAGQTNAGQHEAEQTNAGQDPAEKTTPPTAGVDSANGDTLSDVERPPCPPDDALTPDLEARALYQLGLYFMIQSNYDEAQKYFERVVKEYPGAEAASAATARIEDLKNIDRPPSAQVAAASAKQARSGRAELVVFQTGVGAYVGTVIPTLAEGGGNGVLAGAMVGTIGGLAISLAATRDGKITDTQAAMINYSQLFLTGNLIMWDVALRADSFEWQEPFILSLIGVGAGTAVGKMLGDRYDVPASHVGLVASSGLWATYLTETLLLVAGGDDLDERVYLVAAPLAADLGVMGAIQWLRSSDIKISRSRVRLINLGGIVGGFLGVGTAILADASGRGTGIMMLVGATGGLAAGFAATQDWDATYHPELFAKGPTNSVLALEDGKVRLGNPVPTVAFLQKASDPSKGESAKLVPYAQLNLFGGKF